MSKRIKNKMLKDAEMMVVYDNHRLIIDTGISKFLFLKEDKYLSTNDCLSMKINSLDEKEFNSLIEIFKLKKFKLKNVSDYIKGIQLSPDSKYDTIGSMLDNMKYYTKSDKERIDAELAYIRKSINELMNDNKQGLIPICSNSDQHITISSNSKYDVSELAQKYCDHSTQQML